MNDLDAIDWETVYDQVTGYAFGSTNLEHLEATHGRPFVLALAILDVTSAKARPGFVVDVVIDCTDLDRVRAAECAWWAIHTARLYHAAHCSRPDPEHLAAAVELERGHTAPGELRLPESLLGLPLIPLATDLAATSGRALVVLVAELGEHGGGEYRIESNSILLAAGLVDRPLVLAEVWAHELAHALDPDIDRSSYTAREEFADRLGPLLLEHDPATVTEAAPLIKHVRPLTVADHDIVSAVESVFMFGRLVGAREGRGRAA